MKKTIKHNLITLIVMLSVIVLCMFLADLIQRDFYNVNVTEGTIEIPDQGELYYKLYSPRSATVENKAPGVLLLHGYQNDHETSAAFAIELARRGAVVLALDDYGHGKSSISMRNRGWTNHRVKVNYGNDSESDNTYVEISSNSQLRYKVLMNFSTLSFFDDRYSKGTDGSLVIDSSMGGIAAYAYLASLDNVDSSRLAITGHSMGTWASWSTAAAYCNTDIAPKATVLQCGELFTKEAYDENKYKFNNVLLLTAKYDEFNYFRDYEDFITDSLIKSPLRTEFLNTTSDKALWNTTFGNFEDGSARRCELLITNHRLATHNEHAMKTSLEWFDNAIELPKDIPYDKQTFMAKEKLVFIAMLFGLFSMLPFMNILLETKFFSCFNRPLTVEPKKEKNMKKWFKGAIITVLIAACTYPFMTQLGHGLLPLAENIFRMTIGNGFLSWYLILIIIMIITTLTSLKKTKDDDYSKLGLSYEKKYVDYKLMGKGALLSLCMVAFMYIQVCLCEIIFKTDYRFIWPFFKSFTLTRFGQFIIYIPIFALFFLLNNSKIFAQMRAVHSADPSFKGFINAWWKNAFCMAGGILIIILLEYIPFFLGIAPGADLLFGSTFGGPFMSLLIVFFPQVLIFSLLCTYTYRKTSSVYAGAFTVAILACWIVTGGSAIL